MAFVNRWTQVVLKKEHLHVHLNTTDLKDEFIKHVMCKCLRPHDATLRVLLPLVGKVDEASSWCYWGCPLVPTLGPLLRFPQQDSKHSKVPLNDVKTMLYTKCTKYWPRTPAQDGNRIGRTNTFGLISKLTFASNYFKHNQCIILYLYYYW